MSGGQVKKLLVVELRGEIYILDDAKLEEGTKEYLNSYVPDDSPEEARLELFDDKHI